MINKLIKKMNKRKYKYHKYELEDVNDYFEKSLSSPLLGEGSVSLKFIVNDKKVVRELTLPTSIHYPLNKTEGCIFPKLNTSQIELECNNFFTINLYAMNNIETLLNELAMFTNAEEYLVVQIYAKRIKKQDKLFVDQYEQFLKGVEVPSSNKIVNYIQSQYVDDEITPLTIDMVDMIENKNNDNHYNFQMFIGTNYKSVEKEELVENVMLDMLDMFSHLNSFRMEKIRYDPDIFESDELLIQYKKQVISRLELCSFICKNSQKDDENEEKMDILDVFVHKSEENVQNANSNEIVPTSTYALDTLPSLELLPVQIETNDDDVDMDIPDRIKNALKRVRIVTDIKHVKIIDFKVGSSLIKTTISIPKDKNFTDVKKKSDDIQVALGVNALSIDQGEVADSVSFFIPRINKQPIYLRSLLENDEFIKFAEKYPLPFIIGVDVLGSPIYACLSQLVHILCAGGTGGGKSVWLNQLILTLLMLRKPNELLMYLIDPKQVEFDQFNGFPQVVKVLDDMNKANKLLESLIVEMESRYTKLKEGKVKTLWDYNNKHPEQKIPFIVVVVDEYADLKMVNPTVDDFIARLGQKARASGIHLVIATQRPSVDIIEGTTKSNLPSKISFKLNGIGSYGTILEGKPPVIPTGKGHGVMQLNEQVKDFEQFQGAIITVNATEEEVVLENIKKSFKGEKVEGIKIEKVEEEIKEEPIDKMKRIICETNEVRVGELRKLMEMNINVTTDLMHELSEIGWLNKPDENNRKWSLNEDCEEYIKMRGE